MHNFYFYPKPRKINNMKKTLTSLSTGLLIAGAAQAATITQLLSGPTVNGNQVNGVVATTNVTDASGATFDIIFNLDSIGNGANDPVPRFNTATGSYAVDTSTDANNNHGNTIDGDDGEGLSFTNLAITNFNANGSGFTLADFTDLTFSSLAFGSSGNAQDGVNISFTDFPTHPTGLGGTTSVALLTADNQNLSGIASGTTYDLTALSTYTAPATDLFLRTDNQNTGNRWSVDSLTVTYTSPVPEPSSSALLLGGLGLLALQRRRK